MTIRSDINKRKWIVITGGVLSGLGKGVAAASIGYLLRNYRITPLKCDGYLNVDPGTMNPIEHGEVFVLDDGAEVDMDFGHYERFLGITCRKEHNLTMGKVFDKIRIKERRGDYLGKTVQMIPHVVEVIKDWWLKIANEDRSEISLVEIGGTVGDIENELYIEAARELQDDVGRDNVLYVHLTYIPKPPHVNEQKSKPTQQSISLLKSKGINPDIILARCEQPLTESVKNKISTFSNIKKENIISAVDTNNIYEIPMLFYNEGIGASISDKLGVSVLPISEEWLKLLKNTRNFKYETTVAICGKYTSLEDSYASVVEALNCAGANHYTKINIKWLDTSDESAVSHLNKTLNGVSGVIVPGGFGSRGVEGKIKVIKYCRENNLPFLGICYGLQLAVIEHARNLLGMGDANSTEIDPDTGHPIVDILPEQKTVTDKGGTMRLGAYPAVLKDSMIKTLYYSRGFKNPIFERHRHRYEVNSDFHEVLETRGLVFSGMSPDGTLVEFIERKDHPYFVATQAHPELKSSLLNPAPLFYGLIRAALNYKR